MAFYCTEHRFYRMLNRIDVPQGVTVLPEPHFFLMPWVEWTQARELRSP